MTTASFRFSPKILARLGEELNQSADQSILELVKNSYDADATKCVIELTNTVKPGGKIRIADDGNGMDVNEIKDSWLVLGKSEKSNEVVTGLGRRPAGSKGLGRLAALRMGTSIELMSIKKGNARRVHHLEIDWGEFNTADVVEDVKLEITSKKHTAGGQGTSITLNGIRSPLRSEELRRLARALLLLTDPFGDKVNGFQIQLVAPEFKEIEALLSKKYFDQADFHLQASIDEKGIGSAKILDWQGSSLAEADHADLRRKHKDKKYDAPKAKFDLWVFIFKPDEFNARKVSKTEISEWLNNFGGVHVYQDDIRVAPYGNPGNDWLEMNLARVRNPEERPGTHTSIGRISIPGASKHQLIQKTDRTGFIENEPFEELKSFAQDALNWMAKWRLDAAEVRRGKTREEAPKAAAIQREKVEAAIAMASPKVREALQTAFSGYEKSRDKEADSLRKEIQLYRTLSTAGITAATFSHETQGNTLKVIDMSVNFLRSQIPKIVKVKAQQDKLLEAVLNIKSVSAGLAILGTATLSLVKASKRRLGRVSVHDVVKHTLSLMKPFVSGRDVEIIVNLCKGDPYLRTSEAALESVITNLVNNALTAFERAGTAERKIYITTQVREKLLELKVSDSGPGIVDLKASDIWLPGITTNAEGTGLGLTIVRDTIKDMSGKVEVTAHGSYGGAEFVIQLPILGS